MRATIYPSASLKGHIVVRKDGHVVVLSPDDIQRINDTEWAIENEARNERNKGNVYKG